MRPKHHRSFAAIAGATIAASALFTASTTAQEAEAAAAEAATPEAAKSAAAEKLTVGSAVPELKGITWLQGDPVKSFDEKGKVYMLELWATWCGPCVAIIPHVNDLHKKYADKGLVIVGMNVWEDDIEAPKKFLADQGEGMSYRVAFSGGGKGDFATAWLKPAGVQGIPHAIFIKEGKILYSGHPAQVKDSSIEAMLDGSYDPAAEAKKQAEAEKQQEELRAKVMPLFQAQDWDGILALAKTLEDSDPAKLQLQLTAITQKGDWKALTAVRSELATAEDSPITVSDLDQNAALGMSAGEGAKEYATLALKDYKPAPADAPAPEKMHKLLMSSRLNFLAGNTDAAKEDLAKAKAALETIDQPQMKQQLEPLFPAAEKALADGKFPSLRELLQGQ
ncbi:TlpA disulfide reductase family protein [Rubritalea tangerina]|uniref:TlpA disulfide reductase family protein n=1 Tax=Rubritalea tangerina TaxID=430798 RepID=A0ABW4Z6B4_9BACT